MSLLHGEFQHAEIDTRLERARDARFKHSFDVLRRWVRRSERARIGLERALALEREQSAAASTSRATLPAFTRSHDRAPGWA